MILQCGQMWCEVSGKKPSLPTGRDLWFTALIRMDIKYLRWVNTLSGGDRGEKMKIRLGFHINQTEREGAWMKRVRTCAEGERGRWRGCEERKGDGARGGRGPEASRQMSNHSLTSSQRCLLLTLGTNEELAFGSSFPYMGIAFCPIRWAKLVICPDLIRWRRELDERPRFIAEICTWVICTNREDHMAEIKSATTTFKHILLLPLLLLLLQTESL